MLDWPRIGSFLDLCAVYLTTQLVRCAAFSLVLTGLVMLLRKMLFSERIFLKGMLWAVFLVTPFLGKLKLFYENAAICKATWWMTKGTMSCLWVGRIYTMGILVAVICVFGKRLRLRRLVAGMEKVFFDGIRISVTDMNITPFTIGLLKPKIVLPKTMADSYSREELKAIIQHEQTHIRLGHLWFGLAWDMLRCLLWINPFLTVFQKHFRADMEDICDRVCIQNSGKTAHEYVDSFFAATGSTVVCRHAYLDENGNYSNFTVSVRKDALNEKLRKEAQENAEERIEKSREKARENAEQLAEKLEEKAEEAKGSEKSEEKKVVTEDGTTTPNKAEQLLEEKMAASKDGTIYLNDTDMKTIIEAAQEEDAGKTIVKEQTQVGANLDLKI